MVIVTSTKLKLGDREGDLPQIKRTEFWIVINKEKKQCEVLSSRPKKQVSSSCWVSGPTTFVCQKGPLSRIKKEKRFILAACLPFGLSCVSKIKMFCRHVEVWNKKYFRQF